MARWGGQRGSNEAAHEGSADDGAIRRSGGVQARSSACGLSLHLLRPVLQGSSDQRHAFGQPLQLPSLIPLVEDEAGGLPPATDAHDIAHERQCGSFRNVRMDQAAGVPTA